MTDSLRKNPYGTPAYKDNQQMQYVYQKPNLTNIFLAFFTYD